MQNFPMIIRKVCDLTSFIFKMLNLVGRGLQKWQEVKQ